MSPQLLSRYLSLTAMELLAKGGYLDSEAVARPTMPFVPIKTAVWSAVLPMVCNGCSDSYGQPPGIVGVDHENSLCVLPQLARPVQGFLLSEPTSAGVINARLVTPSSNA